VNIAAPFAWVISAASFSPSSVSISAITTLAPSRAKIRAMLAPIPDAAPVISATLSSSRIVQPPF
jgi:multisubunit Na+/H+ antiporter MnhE subunit